MDHASTDIWTSSVFRWEWTNIPNYGLCLVGFGCCLYLGTCPCTCLYLCQLLLCCHGYESNMFCSDLQEGKYTNVLDEKIYYFLTCPHLRFVLLLNFFLSFSFFRGGGGGGSTGLVQP